MKNYNYTGLKIKIADEIIIINRYILLILLENRENPVNIKHVFDRKVFLTGLLSKIRPAYSGKDTELVRMLKEKLSNIAESDKAVMDVLIQRKEDAAGRISALKNISAAVKAYGINNI